MSKPEDKIIADSIYSKLVAKKMPMFRVGAHNFGYGTELKEGRDRVYVRFKASGKNYKRGLYIYVFSDDENFIVDGLVTIKDSTKLVGSYRVNLENLHRAIEDITDGTKNVAVTIRNSQNTGGIRQSDIKLLQFIRDNAGKSITYLSKDLQGDELTDWMKLLQGVTGRLPSEKDIEQAVKRMLIMPLDAVRVSQIAGLVVSEDIVVLARIEQTQIEKKAKLMLDFLNGVIAIAEQVEAEAPSLSNYKGMFSTEKTGIPFLDSLLSDNGYHYFYKGVSGEIVMMSPDAYLAKVRTDITKSNKDEGIYEEKKERILDGIGRGDKINMPFLSIKVDGVAHKQEGRNRAIIAKERGEELIPVFIEKDLSRKDKIAKGREYVVSAILKGAINKSQILSQLENQKLHRDAIRFIDDNFTDIAPEMDGVDSTVKALNAITIGDEISINYGEKKVTNIPTKINGDKAVYRSANEEEVKDVLENNGSTGTFWADEPSEYSGYGDYLIITSDTVRQETARVTKKTNPLLIIDKRTNEVVLNHRTDKGGNVALAEAYHAAKVSGKDNELSKGVEGMLCEEEGGDGGFLKCIVKAMNETEYNPRPKWWGYVKDGKRYLMRYNHNFAIFSDTEVEYSDYETVTDKKGVESAIKYFNEKQKKKMSSGGDLGCQLNLLAVELKTFIHETDADSFDVFDLRKVGSGQGDQWLGNGIYLQEKGCFKIENYGKNKVEVTLNTNAKIFNVENTPNGKYRDGFVEWAVKNTEVGKRKAQERIDDGLSLDNLLPRDILKRNPEAVEKLKEQGYDGLYLDGELVVYNPDVLQIKPLKETVLLAPNGKPEIALKLEAEPVAEAGQEGATTQEVVEHQKFSDGGGLEQTYKKWKTLVNMSKGELEKFYHSKEGEEAGLSDAEAKSLGIHSGRESARWIMKMKSTSVKDWTDTMWEWAARQIRFIKRMRGNKGALYDENGKRTRKHTSLLIWGHNPEKK
jgi:hypothetical protein